MLLFGLPCFRYYDTTEGTLVQLRGTPALCGVVAALCACMALGATRLWQYEPLFLPPLVLCGMAGGAFTSCTSGALQRTPWRLAGVAVGAFPCTALQLCSAALGASLCIPLQLCGMAVEAVLCTSLQLCGSGGLALYTFAAGRRWQWEPSFVHLCSFAVWREFAAAVGAFLCTCHCGLVVVAVEAVLCTLQPRLLRRLGLFWRLLRRLQLGVGLLRRPLLPPRLLRRLVLWELCVHGTWSHARTRGMTLEGHHLLQKLPDFALLLTPKRCFCYLQLNSGASLSFLRLSSQHTEFHRDFGFAHTVSSQQLGPPGQYQRSPSESTSTFLRWWRFLAFSSSTTSHPSASRIGSLGKVAWFSAGSLSSAWPSFYGDAGLCRRCQGRSWGLPSVAAGHLGRRVGFFRRTLWKSCTVLN